MVVFADWTIENGSDLDGLDVPTERDSTNCSGDLPEESNLGSQEDSTSQLKIVGVVSLGRMGQRALLRFAMDSAVDSWSYHSCAFNVARSLTRSRSLRRAVGYSVPVIESSQSSGWSHPTNRR